MTGRATAAERWPLASNEAAAAELSRAIEARAMEAAPGGTALAVLRRADTRAALRAIGGNSLYLADLARREWETVVSLAANGPDQVVGEALAALGRVERSGPREATRAALRRAKRVVALAVAWADLGGTWPLAAVTSALTRLAETSLRVALDHLLHHETARGRLRPRDTPEPQRSCGFVVLGMGKLGAGELNYSSDVDLVLLYDPDTAGGGLDRSSVASTFSRVARDLVTLMETRDPDGYVFRVDLRLRPDPGSTPPAVSLQAAIVYYESLAETWERAAFIKARPVAGDEDLGAFFLREIGPFIWRRHLDFAAIDDMQAMKARIDAADAGSRGRSAGEDDGVGALLGRDLKRGPGGIREVEFIAQTLQLVWGGGNRALRRRGTVDALQALGEAGLLDGAEVERLAASYIVLRRAEHRLQMVADRQTHRLPADRAGFGRFATFMGFADAAALAAHLLAAMAPVEAAFRAVLSDTPPPDPPLLAGFRDREAASALVGRLREGRTRALRTERARRLHDAVLPVLLAAFTRARDPDAALARWVGLVERLSEGVALLSLLARNPGLVRRIADLLAASPPLADSVAAMPGAIEGLLAPDGTERPPRRELARLVEGRRDPASLETAIETARRLVRAEELRLGWGELGNRIDVDRAGEARTDLAEATVALLLDRVRRAHEARHGRIERGGLVVVALGKAGSRRMIAGSDLDLLLIHDVDRGGAPGGEPHVRGTAPETYYARLAQSLIAALTAPGRDGPLYRCDMRLRPSGRAGPVAVSLPAFERYHREDAWTWERMALARARPVAGPAWLRRRVASAIGVALDRADLRDGTRGGTGAADRVRADAVAMRARLLRDRPAAGPFDAKLRPGGLMEVEFVAQALQLGPHPGLRRSTDTGRALRALGRSGLLARGDARALAAADRFWRVLQSRLRLLHGPTVPEPDLAPSVRDGLASALGDGFEREMDRVAGDVSARFARILGVR